MQVDSTQTNNNPGFLKKLGAATVGSMASGLTVAGAGLGAIALQNQLVKVSKTVTPDEVKILNKAGQQILKESGLAEKGVKILKNFDRATRLQVKNFFDLMPKSIRKFAKRMNPIYQLSLGKNAFFNFKTDNIYCPNKLALSQFHELGHAMNRHGIAGKKSVFGHMLQNLRLDLPLSKSNRMVGLALSAITLTALFKNKKAEGEEATGFWDKTTTFVKNNAGKLAFLSALPIAIEEGLASLKGQKFAKQILSPKLLKKVKLSNAIGFTSYALAATAIGIGTMLAVKVRDKIAQPNVQ